MNAWHLSLAVLATLSPLVTLAYAIGSSRRFRGRSEERALALYLAVRCTMLAVLAFVALFLPDAAYLLVIAGANAAAQLLDVPVHLMRGQARLAVLGGASAVALLALAAVVGLTGTA